MKDPQDVDIVFVIEKSSYNIFQKIINPFCKKLKIRVLLFEDILSNFNIKDTPEEIMSKFGRFTYQTFKKMYAMLYAKYDYYLVLDSESVLLKPTSISLLFTDFYKAPFITSSTLDKNKRCSIDFNILKSNIDTLLNFKMDYWLLENFIWFYDLNILNQLFRDHGSLYTMAEKILHENKDLSISDSCKYGIFEICLYQNYIFKNREKYGYSLINIDEMLCNNLPQDIKQKYIDDFYSLLKGNCGLIEHVALFLTNENVEHFAYLLKRMKFNIIRCDKTTLQNYKLQKKFLDIVEPVILAASQDHYFGVKHNIKQYLIMCSDLKNVTKLKKHLKAFFSPLAKLIIWILEPINILKYLVKTCSSLLLNIIKLKFK